MNSIELNYNAEFASQVMDSIPAGYINKTVCGCGLTTVALENNEDTIVLVPKVGLVLNKVDQYPNKRCNFEILGVYGETSVQDVNDYVTKCNFYKRPIKIMSTYDGLVKVEHLLDACKLVIDESDQVLSLTKSKERRGAIMKMLDVAQQLKSSVSFISATPTDLKYMPKWISEIDQVTMNWSNTTKMVPTLAERTYPFKSLKEEFLRPLKDNGVLTLGSKVIKKVIIYINSVSTAASIVKDLELDKKECGIFCGDSIKNDVKINGIKRYTSGNTPKYLFITSSGFAGIDIYDEEAFTIVVSNTSKDFTMIDILTDLKQAVSRNRCKTNPHYGTYLYIYNQSIFKDSEEDLLNKLNDKRTTLESAVRLYNIGIDNNETGGTTVLGRDIDFSAYTVENSSNGYREINEIVFNADKYYILELRNQYTKGFNIIGATNSSDIIEPIELPKSFGYSDLVVYFIKNYKNNIIDWDIHSNKVEWISIIEDYYKIFKSVEMNITRAKQMIEANGDDFKMLIIKGRKLFNKSNGDNRYTNAQIKTLLQKLYDSNGLNRKAKPTDIYEFFGQKGVKPYKSSGVRGFEIL